MGLAYSFRDSDHYYHGRKHGSMQADMVLQELRVLYLDPQTESQSMVPWPGGKAVGLVEGP